MFIEEDTSCNVLRYRVMTRVDEFALRVLKQGEIKGVFIPGVIEDKDGTFLLIPVSESVKYEDYIRRKSRTLADIEEFLKQAIQIDKLCGNHMLGDSVLLKRLKYTYVTDDKLQLICLPVLGASYETDSDACFFRNVIASGSYSGDERERAMDLLDYINSEGFSSEGLLDLLNKPREPAVKLDMEFDISNNLQSNRKSAFDKIKEFFFPKKSESESFEKTADRIAPSGIYVLAVRSNGEEYPICFGPDVIGTDVNTCSICFPESKVIAENHCRVYFDRNKFYLEDLGTEIGTYLNNEKIQPNKPKVIVHGDLIRVGNEELVFSRRAPI